MKHSKSLFQKIDNNSQNILRKKIGKHRKKFIKHSHPSIFCKKFFVQKFVKKICEILKKVRKTLRIPKNFKTLPENILEPFTKFKNIEKKSKKFRRSKNFKKLQKC